MDGTVLVADDDRTIRTVLIMTAIQAAEAEAYDYLPKPFDLPDLMKRSSRALEVKRRAPQTRDDPSTDNTSDLPLVGRTPAMHWKRASSAKIYSIAWAGSLSRSQACANVSMIFRCWRIIFWPVLNAKARHCAGWRQVRLTLCAITVGRAAAEPVTSGAGDDRLSESVAKHLRRYFDLHGGELPPPGLYNRILREIEAPLLDIALDATGGNQAKCADLLGINRNTLRI